MALYWIRLSTDLTPHSFRGTDTIRSLHHCSSFRTGLYPTWNAVAPVFASSFLHLNLKQATTARLGPAGQRGVRSPEEPVSLLLSNLTTSQPLAQQSQTLFFISSCKGNVKEGTVGREGEQLQVLVC